MCVCVCAGTPMSGCSFPAMFLAQKIMCWRWTSSFRPPKRYYLTSLSPPLWGRLDRWAIQEPGNPIEGTLGFPSECPSFFCQLPGSHSDIFYCLGYKCFFKVVPMFSLSFAGLNLGALVLKRSILKNKLRLRIVIPAISMVMWILFAQQMSSTLGDP